MGPYKRQHNRQHLLPCQGIKEVCVNKLMKIITRSACVLWALTLLLLHCSSDQILSTDDDLFTWNFSGTVVDGYSGRNLHTVLVSYVDNDGTTSVVMTDSSGNFCIQGLPAGQKHFTFVKETTDSPLPSYTQKQLLVGTAANNIDTLTIPVDVSEIIKLYPLTGSITGKIKNRLYVNGAALPTANVFIKVSYDNKDMQYVIPSVFQQATDSSGAFMLNGLPLANGVVVEVLNTSIDDIAYKALEFEHPVLIPNQSVSMGTIYMEPVDLANSSFTFIYSNIFDPHSGIIKHGFPVNGSIVVIANKEIAFAEQLLKRDNRVITTEITLSADTLRITPYDRLEPGALYTLYLTASAASGEIQTVDKEDGNIQFMTAQNPVYITASNVLSLDGSGLDNIPVGITPFYVLSTPPDSGTVTVVFDGGNSPDAIVHTAGDTIYADPVTHFEYNAEITTTIRGKDTLGNKMEIVLDNTKAFVTEKNLYVTASNTMDENGFPAEDFELYDTMWVKYSEPLDTVVENIEWFTPGPEKKIYGKGPNTNASVWVHDDTLFVLPDIRLQLSYGDVTGFKVQVQSHTGKKSPVLAFEVSIEHLDIITVWTNTVDSFGQPREDFGLLESVVVVANLPILQVDNVTEYGSGVYLPDISFDNFSIRNDTIIYRPSLKMRANKDYGMVFSITLTNGIKRKKVLRVRWHTLQSVKIVHVNNKEDGKYRMFRVWGDSVIVTFSEAIDTSAGAPTRFKVYMRDNDDKYYYTTTRWDSSLTTATIYIYDTLKTAQYDADPAYTEDARYTRAIEEVSFDLTTMEGEQVNNLGPMQSTIQIHSEPGLCIMQSNIINNHNPENIVDDNEEPVEQFDPEVPISITFNRPIDTAEIAVAPERYFNIVDVNQASYPFSISFSSDACTAFLTPTNRLNHKQYYYLWVYMIPGYGIKGAEAIRHHAGTVSGDSWQNYLLDEPFKIKCPDISHLTTVLLPDSNTYPGVAGNRIGSSAGQTYDDIVGSQNVNTTSYLRVKILEAAWNPNHADSVSGYQAQVQKIDRSGKATGWFYYTNVLPTKNYSTVIDNASKTTLNIYDSVDLIGFSGHCILSSAQICPKTTLFVDIRII